MDKHYEYKWWKESVGYQIYPKTFYDANGDGIGDLQGIIEKLPYLAELGIGFLWICPFFKSPMDDNGYDVSDYLDINELFGSMDDAKELIKEAEKYNIKIIVDLVLNHTSDEHPWFVDVRKNPNSEYRDFYIIKEEKDGKEPTNWGSFFGGSAWERLNDHEYYLKIFSKKMPDLNWANSNLRKELYDIASWWLKQGVDGFRIDAIAHIEKDQTYSDSSLESITEYVSDWSKFSNFPKVHTYLKEFHKEVLKPYDAFAVGEVGGDASVEDALQYSRYGNNELDVTFTFSHMWCNNLKEATSIDTIKTDVPYLRETLQLWQTSMFGKAWYPLYWNNHDFNRLVSNYGSHKYHEKSAKALATVLYFMWGTPFIYQGEEIGMTNYPFTSIDEFEDVQARGQYAAMPESEKEKFLTQLILSSRDNVRTTMQWDDSKNGGFTNNQTDILVNPNYVDINVEKQRNNPDSIWNYYKKIINFKKTDKTIIYGNIEFIDLDEDCVISYYRYDDNKRYLIVVNLSDEVFDIIIEDEIKSIVLSNTSSNFKKGIQTLQPYDAFVVQV